MWLLHGLHYLLSLIILTESLRWWLRNRSPSSNSFNLLNLKFYLRFLAGFFTESLILFIHIHDQLLYMIASYGIFIEIL